MEKDIKHVYIVTDGDYHEYKIIGVYSTEEKAQEYINRRATAYSSNLSIDYRILDPTDHMLPYIRIHMDISGAVSDHCPGVFFELPENANTEIGVTASKYFPYHTCVQTESMEDARRIARERLERFKEKYGYGR
jgi:hypothetical protein